MMPPLQLSVSSLAMPCNMDVLMPLLVSMLCGGLTFLSFFFFFSGNFSTLL
jgi:hypothetical protein